MGKKSTGGAFLNIEERCQIIEWLYQTNQKHGWGYSIRQLCKLLAVNRAWFYERKKVIARREKEEAEFKAAVEGILLEFNGWGIEFVRLSFFFSIHASSRTNDKVNSQVQCKQRQVAGRLSGHTPIAFFFRNTGVRNINV